MHREPPKPSSPSVSRGDTADEVRIFDHVSRRHLEILQVILLDCAEFTHLPELYEVFGRATVLKFLDVFSGMTFTVPPRSALEDVVRDVSIFLRLEGADEGTKARVVREIAREKDLSPAQVREIHYRVDQRMQRIVVEKPKRKKGG